MPKGIRKACANCIKARLACDDGRPCQRCIVHQCECIAVPRKPRVKKQKLEHEPPPFLADNKYNSDVVAPNWEYASGTGTFSTFTLERPPPQQQQHTAHTAQQAEPSATSSPSLFDTLQLSPLNQLSPPMLQMSPLQMPPSSPPRSPNSNSWTQNSHTDAFQQLSQSIQLSPQMLLPSIPAQAMPTPSPPPYEQGMLSLLLNDKASAKLLSDWQADAPVATLIDGQVYAFDSNHASAFKKLSSSHGSSPLPTPKNSTRLFPAPVAVFDKQKFQLLDANEAMAKFVGHTNVGDLSTVVVNMDDLLGTEASDMAKDAYKNFVMNPLACYPIGEVRTRSGNKTVEFNVDLTDQLLILTFKSVFDTYSMGLPDVPRIPTKSDAHFASSQCNCKACEFLSPID